MKRVKRGLWTAASGFWLWLGFGLYRELPRDLGPVMCTPTLDDDEMPLGFMSGGVEFVSGRRGGTQTPSTIRVWDTATGKLKRTFDGPLDALRREEVCPRLGVLFSDRGHRPDANARVDQKEEGDPQVSVLNLHSGHWTDFDVATNWDVVFHPRKPWCLCRAPGQLPEEVCVIDVERMQVIFRWRDHPRRPDWDAMLPYFIGDDYIAIAFRSLDPDKPGGTPGADRIELWAVPKRATPERIIEGADLGHPIAAAADRFAWPALRTAERRGLKVLDVSAGRFLAPYMSEAADTNWGGGIGMFLSRDGKAVLVSRGPTDESTLWEVDSGRLLWRSAESEFCGDNPPHDDRFFVTERWAKSGLWELFVTFAVRRLSDAGLELRCWHPPFPDFVATIPAGPIAFDGMHIRQGTYHVNWPLLALCQSILALPLIILWAVFRWRRHQRLRPASVQS